MEAHRGNTNQNHVEIPFHPTKMAKIKKTVTGVDEDVEKLEPHTILVGLESAAATLENSLAFPQKLNADPELYS